MYCGEPKKSVVLEKCCVTYHVDAKVAVGCTLDLIGATVEACVVTGDVSVEQDGLHKPFPSVGVGVAACGELFVVDRDAPNACTEMTISTTTSNMIPPVIHANFLSDMVFHLSWLCRADTMSARTRYRTQGA